MRGTLLALTGAALVAACGQQGAVEVIEDERAQPPATAEDPGQPDEAGLVAFDLYARQTAPPPPVQRLLDLDPCEDPGDLADWATDALAPFGEVSGELEVSDLAEVIDTTPVLGDPEETPTCVVAGTVGDAEVWELRAADGSALARGVASERLVASFSQVYGRQEQLGGVNFGQSSTASGQYVAGVWRDDRMELELSEVEPRRRSLLVVEWPGDGPPAADLDGQVLAEARGARLTTATLDLPDYFWPSPVPQRLPPGFVRCAGPAPNGGFQAYDTDLCHADGRTIHIRTDNEGGNPVPDPPFETEVREVDDRLVLAIDTPVEDVTISVPAALGRETLDAMAATIPLLDRRVWFPSAGRGDELQSAFDDDWWRKTLEAAGATDVDVQEAPIACPAIEDGEPCPGPDHRPSYEGTATAPDGSRVEFHVAVMEQPTDPSHGPSSTSRVTTVGTTDLLVTEGYAPDARALCGGVSMSLRPEGVGTTNRTDWDVTPAADLLGRVLEVLAC